MRNPYVIFPFFSINLQQINSNFPRLQVQYWLFHLSSFYSLCVWVVSSEWEHRLTIRFEQGLFSCATFHRFNLGYRYDSNAYAATLQQLQIKNFTTSFFKFIHWDITFLQNLCNLSFRMHSRMGFLGVLVQVKGKKKIIILYLGLFWRTSLSCQYFYWATTSLWQGNRLDWLNRQLESLTRSHWHAARIFKKTKKKSLFGELVGRSAFLFLSQWQIFLPSSTSSLSVQGIFY